MDQQNQIKEIQNKLRTFRLNLPKNPSMSEHGIAMYSDHNRQDVQEILWARILNQMNDVLVTFENQTAWETIDIILSLIYTNRINTLDTIWKLHQLNRLNEIVKICELVKLTYWNEIYYIDFLASQNRLDEITMHLSNFFYQQALTNIPSPNLELKNLINYTAPAGLTQEQAQNINRMYGESLIKIEEHKNIELNSAQIEVAKQSSLNNEKLRYQKLQNDIEKVVPLTENSISQINYGELEQSYIETNKLVRLSANGSFEIYKWDDKLKRYTRIDSNKTLNTDINSYAYKIYGKDIEITSKEIDVMVNRMRHNDVPLLEESQNVIESNENQIFFLNGYYDLKERKFNLGDTSQYFHTSTIPCIYDENAPEPEIFDNMLCRIFEEDKTKIKLAYQIIGAIISNVPLKYIYVFQGISHGGKSTLSECIIRLFNEDEVEFKGSINELDENRVSSFERRIKLLTIDDSPSDKWSSATISYLKTRSRGVSSKKATMFKILLITNYDIGFKTENGRDESIENRIVILPFQKNMVSENELYIGDEEKLMIEKIKNYLNEGFDNEKSGIIKKALLAFQDVLENDNNFINRYPLNENTGNTLQVNCSEKMDLHLKNLILSVMEFTDDKDEYSTAKDITEYLNQEIQQGRLKNSSLKIFDRQHEVGKRLKEIFGNELNSFRRKDETLYNLKFKLQ